MFQGGEMMACSEELVGLRRNDKQASRGVSIAVLALKVECLLCNICVNVEGLEVAIVGTCV